MTATELPKCLRKYADRIADVSDDRGNDDGYWVYLASGWRDPDGETHCIHEDSPSAAANLMLQIIRCTRPGCCDNGHPSPTSTQPA